MATEPPESMYPPNTEKLKFQKSQDIWQGLYLTIDTKTMIFVEANSYIEAHKKVKDIFKLMNLDVSPGSSSIQTRRLPICEIRR